MAKFASKRRQELFEKKKNIEMKSNKFDDFAC